MNKKTNLDIIFYFKLFLISFIFSLDGNFMASNSSIEYVFSSPSDQAEDSQQIQRRSMASLNY